MSPIRPTGGSGLEAALARIATLRSLTGGRRATFEEILSATNPAGRASSAGPSTGLATGSSTVASTATTVSDRPVSWPPATTTAPRVAPSTGGSPAGATTTGTTSAGATSTSGTADTGAATGWYAALPAVGEPWAAIIEAAAAEAGIDPALLGAVVWTESGFRADAVSPAGAVGLTQLMPATAQSLGVDPTDPEQNLAGGARLLRNLIDRYDGNPTLALAAYNAGPGRVDAARGVPAIAETQQFVVRVAERWSQLAASARTTSADGRTPQAAPAAHAH